MKTIRIIDPQSDVHSLREYVFRAQGYAVNGQPDLVVTCQRMPARFWTRQGVPVAAYDKDDIVDVNEMMATVGELLSGR